MTDGSNKLYIPPYLNNQSTAINLLPPAPDILDQTQQSKTVVAKILAAQDDHKYLGGHPEIKVIIKFILRQIFIERPKDILTFVAGFVQREDFPFEICKLIGETEPSRESSGTGSADEESGDENINFEDLFANMFAGMKTEAKPESLATLRMSYNALLLRSRSRSIVYDEMMKRTKSGDRKRSVYIEKMVPIIERDRKSIGHEGPTEERRRSSSRRTSMDRHPLSPVRSQIRGSILQHEKRQSLSIPDRERRRSTKESELSHPTGEELKQKSETGISGKDDGEDKEDDYVSEYSSSYSWDSSSSSENELNEDDRALLEGQMLFLGMLGKMKVTKPLNLDIEEVRSDGGSEGSVAKRAQRAIREAFSTSEEEMAPSKAYIADNVSIYAPPNVSKENTVETNISEEEEDEEFN